MISGPHLTVGRYGNAVYTPNTEGFTDDNVINLGTHDNDCFGNVSLCTNGATLSFWMKAGRPSYGWPKLLDGSWFEFWFRFKNDELLATVRLQNGTHRHDLIHFAKITYNQWHNVGMTFSPGNGFEVYFDGCKTIRTGIQTSNSLNPVHIELGCAGGDHCAKINYDEIRFWTATMSPSFMWSLSQM